MSTAFAFGKNGIEVSVPSSGNLYENVWTIPFLCNVVAAATEPLVSVCQAMTHVAVPGIRSFAIGIVLGQMICLGVLRVMRSVLYGVSVSDATSMAGVVLF